MVKIFLFFLFLSLPFISGCRDYLNNIEYDKPPVLITNSRNYSLSDTIIVDLTNVSNKTIYSTEIVSYIEIQSNGGWNEYASFICETCTELSIVQNETVSYRGRIITSPGTYRCASLYGKIAGVPPDSKSKVYSNEFTVTN
jgi:hypothetical protein